MSMADRDYIIQRIRTKAMTADMFEYEKLTCPYSLSQLFTYNDIWELYEIANSVKLASKPSEKAKRIDVIMKSRGFEKLQPGTNRVCYRFIEDSSFVVKVAFTSTGLKDNPAEFINQRYLEPFCTKVFECAPNGVVATFERVHAIKNREEYYTIRNEVFDLITQFILKNGMLMEDIGSWYFMNVGVRPGFGPVYLDFSFLYLLDDKKIYCTKPDNNSYTGLCEGEIDYDPGFNFLYCTKCGAKYKAIELAKRVESNRTGIRKSRKIGGRKIMKMIFNGGDKNCKNEEVISKGGQFATSIPRVTVKPVDGKRENREKGKVGVIIKETPKPDVVVENNPVVVEDTKKETMSATKASELELKPVEEPKKEEIKVLDKSDGICPVDQITIDSFKNKLNELVDEYSYLLDTKEAPENVVEDFLIKLTNRDSELISKVRYLFTSDEYSYEEDDFEDVEEDNTTDEEATVDEPTSITEYDSDVSRFEAVMVDIHDVVDSIPSENVLLIKNVGSDGYVTVGDNQLFVIDMIDGNYISTVSLVSKDYLENLEDEVKKFENLEIKEAPTGV